MKKSVCIAVILLGMILLFIYPASSQSRRDKRDQPEKLLDSAGIKPGMSVGEAGGWIGLFDLCPPLFSCGLDGDKIYGQPPEHPFRSQSFSDLSGPAHDPDGIRLVCRKPDTEITLTC